MDANRRVVITGAGVVSPIGNDVETFWNNLLAGKSGVIAVDEDWIGRQTEVMDRGEKKIIDVFQTRVYAPVRDFDESRLGFREGQRSDFVSKFAIDAARQAIENAGLETRLVGPDKQKQYEILGIDTDRAGVMIGTGIGGQTTDVENYERYLKGDYRNISPLAVPMIMANAVPGMPAIKYKFHGPSGVIATACATGTDTIGHAYQQIILGKADLMLAGGSEALLRDGGYTFYLFNKAGAMTTRHYDDPTKASRPFDKDRDGFVMGEGAGVLVLEELEHAKARNAPILAEVVNYHSTTDAYNLTDPDPNGTQVIRLMKEVMAERGIDPKEVDYITAHGTSTIKNDEAETQAIKAVFGDHAYNLLVNSSKSMIGHSLGASGALEAIATALSLKHGKVHPTINYETVDPGDPKIPGSALDLNFVPDVAVVQPIRIALTNSYGFGGHNATLLLAKYEG